MCLDKPRREPEKLLHLPCQCYNSWICRGWVPTRELAIQVAEAIYRYGHHLGGRVLPVYGGQAYARQQQRLAKGVPMVVGTPGRTLDLVRQGALDLGAVR